MIRSCITLCALLAGLLLPGRALAGDLPDQLELTMEVIGADESLASRRVHHVVLPGALSAAASSRWEEEGAALVREAWNYRNGYGPGDEDWADEHKGLGNMPSGGGVDMTAVMLNSG